MISALLALALTASAQASGALSPTSDVSNTRVKATGAYSLRALKDRLADTLQVKDFGAVCDGVTDDTAAFARAMVRVEALGGARLELPAGTCIVKAVELVPFTTLVGAGVGTTTLKLKSGLTIADYTTDRTAHPVLGVLGLYNSYPSGGYNANLPLDGIQLRDFTYNCNYAGSPGIDTWGIYLNGVTNARVENVKVTNCGSHGFTFKESTWGIFSHLRGDSNGANGAGDGLVLLSRSSDNLVTDSSFSNNASGGVEDEGRFGSYLVVNRNARNRFHNLVLSGNSDNGGDSVFADYSEWRNITVLGGASGPNAACFQFVGSTNGLLDGFRCATPGREGVRIWSEVFGPDGVNTTIVIRNAEITDTPLRGVVVEGLKGGSIAAKIRGVAGGNAVSLSAIGYGRTGADLPCTGVDGGGRPLGYGFGTYQVGQAYLASPNCRGYGAFVQSGNWIYELTAAFTGTGLSVTAPTCAAMSCTSTDNGGTWTARGPVGSSDVTLDIDYDGSTGYQAVYGIYAYEPLNLTVRGTILHAGTNDVWIDGASGTVSGLRLENAVLKDSGNRTLNLTAGVLTGANSYVKGGDLSGSGAALNLSAYAGELLVDPQTIGVGISVPTQTYGTGAPSADAAIGSIYLRLDGSTTTTLYIKTAAGAGAGNWTAK